MKNHIRLTRLSAVAVAALSAMIANAETKLTIGDPAPPLKASYWVKGFPITSLAKGKVYVVEFWATWCHPCKAAMPHLTELAKKFEGRVTFIGVDVREQGAKDKTDKLVAAFVKDQGEKMGYNVCCDGEDKFMFNRWLTAGHSTLIPTAFVVDGEGRIADMVVGYSAGSSRLGDDLDGILAGTYDYKAAKDRSQEEVQKLEVEAVQQERQRKFGRTSKPVNAAMQAKDYAKALVEIDKAVAADSTMEQPLARPKLRATLHTDETKGLAMAKKMGPDGPWIVTQEDGLSNSSYEWAALTLRSIVDNDPKDWPSMPALAFAYFRLGDRVNAVGFQQKFIEHLKERKLNGAFLDGAELTLKKYQDATVKAGDQK